MLAGGLLLRAGGPALWAGLTAGPPGAAAWSAGWAWPLVPVGQLLLLACLLTALYAPGGAFAGVLPTRASLGSSPGCWPTARRRCASRPPRPWPLTGLLALTTLFVGLIAVAADLLAVAGRQAALAGLGLLVLACVPVATTTGGIGLVALAAPAAGLRPPAVGRPAPAAAGARARPAGRGSSGTGVVAAVRTGVAALLAGIVIGALVPTLREGSLATGLGGGTGSSTGTSLDPVAALQGQLTLPEPIAAAPARHLGRRPRLPAGGGAGPVRRRERLVAEQPRRRDVDRRRRPARAPPAGADRPAR